MEAVGLCKATEELSDWLSPLLVVSITFNIIGLVALVYFLYQVMGESFVKVDLFSQRRTGAGDGEEEEETSVEETSDSFEDLPKKRSGSDYKLMKRKTKK